MWTDESWNHQLNEVGLSSLGDNLDRSIVHTCSYFRFLVPNAICWQKLVANAAAGDCFWNHALRTMRIQPWRWCDKCSANVKTSRLERPALTAKKNESTLKDIFLLGFGSHYHEEVIEWISEKTFSAVCMKSQLGISRYFKSNRLTHQ